MSGTISDHWNAVRDVVSTRSLSAYGESLSNSKSLRERGQRQELEIETAGEGEYARAPRASAVERGDENPPTEAPGYRSLAEGEADRIFAHEAGRVERALSENGREGPRTVTGDLEKAALYREIARSPDVADYAKGMARHYVESAREVRQAGGPIAEKMSPDRWVAKEVARMSAGEDRHLSHGRDR